MLAPVLVLVVAASDAEVLRACAEKAIAAAPEKEREELLRWLNPPGPAVRLDEQERRAMAGSDRAYSLLLVAEEAGRRGDLARAGRIAGVMEADARGKTITYEMDLVRRETHLARAQAAAGRGEEARRHVVAARTLVGKVSDVVRHSAHREILLAALALGDEAIAKAEETAFFDAVTARGDEPGARAGTEVIVAGRDLGYLGFGRRAIPWAERVRGLVPQGVAAHERDRVLAAILEGTKARKDLPLCLDLVAAMGGARTRILELEQLWIGLEGVDRRGAPFLAAARALAALEPGAPDVDDFARVELVEVLADVGLAVEALAVTGRIRSPWSRARAEAVAALGLASIDRARAAALARAALKRAKTPGARTDVDNDRMDIDHARWVAASALARTGAVEEGRRVGVTGAPYPVDVAIGLRDKPAALSAWWKTIAPAERARVLLPALREKGEIGDPAFLLPLCQ